MDSIEYYNKYAAKVFEETVNEDTEKLTSEFLGLLEDGDTILDMGCGSGRDSLTFYNLGYDVTPLDASVEMCKLAEIHTGLEVLCMNYQDMEFDGAFDGVWACGALVHIPKEELPEILGKIAKALVENGVFYLSMRQGEEDGFRGERFFNQFTEKELKKLLEQDGLFEVEKEWVTPDVRSNHPDTTWINVLARRK